MNGVPLKENLEAILIDVNGFINIDDHRQEYAEHFNFLTDKIFNKLRQHQPFGYLFNGFQLEGSYGDNLKVGMPDEFDLVFHIKFPERSLIKVLKDDDMPGNVHLDFNSVLHKIAREKQHEITLRKLQSWLNNDNYLLVEKFQYYLQSCFDTALKEMGNRITFNNEMATLQYSKNGPAHTITVVGDSTQLRYSVDYVPGILLQGSQSVIPNHVDQWEAIPKPDLKLNHNSFRSSFYRQEQQILKNKHNLKNALRMMKKFRDSHQNMYNMKSYFIKTLFLRKTQETSESFWNKSLTAIIIEMFNDMEDSLLDRELLFYWDDLMNMYSTFSNGQLQEMLTCVESARKTLEEAAGGLTPALQRRVYRIFLNSKERMPKEVAIIKESETCACAFYEPREEVAIIKESETCACAFYEPREEVAIIKESETCACAFYEPREEAKQEESSCVIL